MKFLISELKFVVGMVDLFAGWTSSSQLQIVLGRLAICYGFVVREPKDL
jgi:hypothetical protein